ncbi:MAG TPA: M20/M25/M40 family metallo-hydrolase [Bryobacteraceae bacterium]|nr:M20/M25/M40 family metallo-hydrolase [Bryobacteraceae bacterium]
MRLAKARWRVATATLFFPGIFPKFERSFCMTRKILALVGSTALLLMMARPAISAPGERAQTAATDDGTLKALVAIAGAGALEAHTYQDLEELSDDIGARVTGSPDAARAIAWGVVKMKAIGLENVHTEPWKISRGWTRVSADAELVAPIHRRLMVDSLGWVGSTAPGGAEADLVAVNGYQLQDELKNNSGNWRGKVLLIVQKGEPPKDRMSSFVKFGSFLIAAHNAGAVAVIGGQGGRKSFGMHLTHTGALGFDTYYDIPVVSMAAEDQQQLERYLSHGQIVRLKINVQNRATDGPVESANVVGEIRGTQNPEQVIVVGGHLDSWDLASGTTDNGCGTAVTLGAAEAIVKSGFKPRRTIRFVLFTGEEQGLLGSLAYVKAHQSEMANYVAALILDAGQGAVTGFQVGGHAELIPEVQKFAASLQSFGDLQVDDEVEFGTDTGPFTLAGLPGINLNQDTSDYKYTHHSAVDTFDKVKAEVLDRNATVMALAAFWIADRPERLASPWPQEKTAQMLVDKHQDGMLKAFNIWPFGDLGTPPATQ